MKVYKEFQFGWLIFVIIIPIQLLIAYLFINDLGDRPFTIVGFAIINSILIVTYLCFFGLTIIVNVEKISIVYGIGFPRRTIAINQIRSVTYVKTPWYYGWGIRFMPKGMLYNISGTEGVELKFKGTDQVIQIGSKHPQQLKQEIIIRLQ